MTYTVTLTFECMDAESPYDATLKALDWIKKDASDMVYDVEEEEGEKNKYTVDLSEDEEDAVLLNND